MATSFTFTKLAASLASGLIDFSSDDIGVLLLDTLTIGTLQDDAQFVADVLAAGAETPSSRKLLTGVDWSQSGHVFTLTADDPTWASVTFSPGPRYALFYDDTPLTDATKPVINLWDDGAPNPVTSNTFEVNINPSGLLTATAA